MITTRWLSQPASYHQVWTAMRDFTETRNHATPDQIWLVEHAPVYTLGQAGKAEHVLNSAGIPVVPCDRGGQVTYHGPGQVTAYCLLNLRRYHLFVKEYVMLLESVMVDMLCDLGLTQACTRPGAPGVYVPLQTIPSQHTGVCVDTVLCYSGSAMPNAGNKEGTPDSRPLAGADTDTFQGLAKIAALGIKVRNGCTYHGLALNVDMDLTPFSGINPCGYQGMPTTDLRSCGVSLTVQEAGDLLAERLTAAIIDYGQRKAQKAHNHDATNSATAH